MKIPRFIVGLLILILITLSASAKTQDDPSGDLANSLLTRAYEYRLKGRFQNAETILRYGIKILSLEKEGQVGAASLKIELARVIIRKTFHINTSDKEAIALYRNVFHFANENNNKKLIGKALYGIGFYEFKAGSDSWDKALRNLEESLKVRREIDDSFGISQSLFTIGTIYQRRGQNKQATRVYRESLGFARKAKSDYMEGLKNNICGKVTRQLVAGSVEVFPINNFGAVQIGMHTFYNNQEPNAISKPSKFIVIWKKEANIWQMSRVVSLH